MSDFKKSLKKSLPIMFVSFIGVTTYNMLSKKTVQSFFRGQLRKFKTGSREKEYQIIESVERNADQVIECFEKNGINPSKICIDGIPGSGKSTLGRAIARKTGFRLKTLKWHEMSEPFKFESEIIYENCRLLRTQNIEFFDVVLYIDCPANLAKNQIIERDRNGMLADVVNLDIMKKIGDTAFDMLDGETIFIKDSFIKLKIRPQKGYNDINNLKYLLFNEGIDLEQKKFSKEQMLYMLCFGKPKQGFKAYVNLDAYNKEILAGINAAFNHGIKKINRLFKI